MDLTLNTPGSPDESASLAKLPFLTCQSKMRPTKGEINVGPKFFRDQFEDWSKEEIHRFEEGNQKFQKEFTAIRDNYLPWKEINSIIEFYYMWKTSDRCVDQKKTKNDGEGAKAEKRVHPAIHKGN